MLRGKAWGGKGCRTAERRAVLRNDLNFPSGRCLMSISSIYGLLGSWGGVWAELCWRSFGASIGHLQSCRK